MPTKSDKTWAEYGYRMPNGTEVWQEDYGRDGAWTPVVHGGLPYAIDVYDSTTFADFRQQLRGEATPLARTVTVIYDEFQFPNE